MRLVFAAGSLRSIYRREVASHLARPSAERLLADADVAHLPPAVRRYLARSGALGQTRVLNFRATLRGEIRSSVDAGWMRFEAEQHNFYDEPARLFLLHATRFGVPFDALHLYVGADATMQVKVASLLRMVDARGREMNQSETVTLFNDMCVLAPATLIAPSITWEELDDRTVKGTFTNAGNTISALLSFDESAELRNFVSDDRFESSDGVTYEKYRWSTPVGNFRDFEGRRVASRGEASWRMPAGEFVYVRLEVTSIAYNVEAVGQR